jgi:PRTRC genetic system protein B
MQPGIEIGQNLQFKLHKALLVYTSGQKCFVTEHDIRPMRKGSAPVLGPAQMLTIDFVNSMVKSLDGNAEAELLPENILAKGSHSIAWWTPAQRRQMFFQIGEGKAKSLNGKIFPHPPLVWVVSENHLFLRALSENKRPTASTKMAVAPYWNISDNGAVCLGSMRNPNTCAVSSIAEWENGFYGSAFTHSNVGRCSRHKDGFEGLWGSLAGKRTPFPAKMLIPLPQKLAEFLAEVKA